MDVCSIGPFDLRDRSGKGEAFTHMQRIQSHFLGQMVHLVPSSLKSDKGDLVN